MEATGFCWKCGRKIKNYHFEKYVTNYSTTLFCCQKHQEQYDREQERQIRKGKRGGYGLAGSTH